MAAALQSNSYRLTCVSVELSKSKTKCSLWVARRRRNSSCFFVRFHEMSTRYECWQHRVPRWMCCHFTGTARATDTCSITDGMADSRVKRKTDFSHLKVSPNRIHDVFNILKKKNIFISFIYWNPTGRKMYNYNMKIYWYIEILLRCYINVLNSMVESLVCDILNLKNLKP